MKKILLYLLLFMAITMASVVAYVSVNGLLQIFTGAGIVGLILFSVIEIAKIVATSAIHTYGKIIGKLYTLLLSLFIVISMLITSMGIYGFLSSSYKDSYTRMEITNNKIELLVEQKTNIQTQLTQLNTDKNSFNQTSIELTKALSNNYIEYRDNRTGNMVRTSSSANRKAFETQLNNANKNIESLNIQINDLSKDLTNIENEILELKINNDASAELSSLQYLSDVTGMTMDNVMKWFILILIIIGDPMAVLMIIVFNKVVNSKKSEDNDEIKKDGDNEMTPDEFIDDEYGEMTLDEIEEDYDSPVKEEEIIDSEDNNDNTVIEDLDIKKTYKENKKPIIPTGQMTKDDIEEIKRTRNRGFSVDVPSLNKDTYYFPRPKNR